MRNGRGNQMMRNRCFSKPTFDTRNIRNDPRKWAPRSAELFFFFGLATHSTGKPICIPRAHVLLQDSSMLKLDEMAVDEVSTCACGSKSVFHAVYVDRIRLDRVSKPRARSFCLISGLCLCARCVELPWSQIDLSWAELIWAMSIGLDTLDPFQVSSVHFVRRVL